MSTTDTGHFKKFLKELEEETTAGDIAGVDSKLDMAKRPKHLTKGKMCKLHHLKNCEECSDEVWNDDE